MRSGISCRRNDAPPGSPIAVIWVDEFQNHLNSFDPKFLAECRSHRGCMFVLTQSLHSYYAALNGGQAAEHQANALLTNPGTQAFFAARAMQRASGCGRAVYLGNAWRP